MFRGVGVKVAVEVNVGIAATVCTDAASAVWAINELIAFGSNGGMGVGVANEGTQPTTSIRIMNQMNNFILMDAMFPCDCERNLNGYITYDSMISFTRPIAPLSKRTLIPWGCVGDFVRISFTTPLVNLPVR